MVALARLLVCSLLCNWVHLVHLLKLLTGLWQEAGYQGSKTGFAVFWYFQRTSLASVLVLRCRRKDCLRCCEAGVSSKRIACVCSQRKRCRCRCEFLGRFSCYDLTNRARHSTTNLPRGLSCSGGICQPLRCSGSPTGYLYWSLCWVPWSLVWPCCESCKACATGQLCGCFCRFLGSLQSNLTQVGPDRSRLNPWGGVDREWSCIQKVDFFALSRKDICKQKTLSFTRSDRCNLLWCAVNGAVVLSTSPPCWSSSVSVSLPACFLLSSVSLGAAGGRSYIRHFSDKNYSCLVAIDSLSRLPFASSFSWWWWVVTAGVDSRIRSYEAVRSFSAGNLA